MDDTRSDVRADVAVLKNTAGFQAAAIGELKENHEDMRQNIDDFFKQTWPKFDKRIDQLEAKLDTAIKLEQKVIDLENDLTSLRSILWKVGSAISGLSVTAPTLFHKLLELLAPLFGLH